MSVTPYTTILGMAFVTEHGENVKSFQLCFNGSAVATADFTDGHLDRFLFADSHGQYAKEWLPTIKPRWLACGLCHGTGKQKDYEDAWDCPPCDGKGGSWI